MGGRRLAGARLSAADLSCVTLDALLELAEDLRRDPATDTRALAGNTVACPLAPATAGAAPPAFEAEERLVMVPVLLPGEDLQLAGGEPVGDAARALAANAALLIAHASSRPTADRLCAAVTS
jgi:hypothetical protein